MKPEGKGQKSGFPAVGKKQEREERIFEGGKEISQGKFFPRDRKVEMNFPREISFPPLNILFFPGLGNIFQRDKVNKIVHQGNSLFMIQ
jgi:hypothetical protein